MINNILVPDCYQICRRIQQKQKETSCHSYQENHLPHNIFMQRQAQKHSKKLELENIIIVDPLSYASYTQKRTKTHTKMHCRMGFSFTSCWLPGRYLIENMLDSYIQKVHPYQLNISNFFFLPVPQESNDTLLVKNLRTLYGNHKHSQCQ